ncbi:glutathione S-transferase N-terminal domain-containing protein [Phyllobacterium sp. SB3]|uniref:glutathione S-transferase family protein n=1 Tax=Phyllobacterium sp. SB3 TaxID=3156073 RepID=UPI0032AF0C93
MSTLDIDFYTWITPNGLKVSIALEEFGLPYRAHTIDITRGDQFTPSYLAINPGAKIPAIVDHGTGMTLTESSAILIYLADKTGRFLAKDGPSRYRAFEWLIWQTGNFGPTIGHAHHFLTYHAGKAPFAEELFAKDTQRLYRTLDAALRDRRYLSDDYSIADIAIWPWVSRFERHKIDLNDYPEVRRWYLDIAKRDAVQRGYRVPVITGEIPVP